MPISSPAPRRQRPSERAEAHQLLVRNSVTRPVDTFWISSRIERLRLPGMQIEDYTGHR
jgi:hypothetical protein